MSAVKKHPIKTAVGSAALIVGLATGLVFGGAFAPAPVEAAPKKMSKPAKNVIVLISDGWGYNQIKATNYYEGVRKQTYERFPFKFGMSTFMIPGSYDPAQAWADFNYVKSGGTDSAAAATAMSTGYKTYNGAIGVDVDRNPVKHAAEYAEENGKATGVVTSVQLSHATPAAFVAHNVSRNNYAEIANEMIYDSATDVIMGCGAPDYDNSGNPGPQNTRYVGGAATWADITDDFSVTGADADGDGVADDWSVIRSRAQFQALAVGDTPSRVLGIPYVYETLQQSRGGYGVTGFEDPYVVPLIETVPTLEEMTKAALNVLDKDEDGFFLMVEGGAVDWTGHANQSGRLIEEQTDFNATVGAVIAWVNENSNWGETLVVVTGDHETGYLTGPGSDPTWEPVVDNGAGRVPGMEWHSGDHTNQLIPFFAKGVAGLLFKWMVDGTDPVRGKYIDNTDLGKVLNDILK